MTSSALHKLKYVQASNGLAMPNIRNNALIRIVDDDADIRESLGLMLESEGWQSIAFDSAEDFLTGDMPSMPGAVLLDIQMERMNGLDLQEEMNNRGYSLPIIFITGHGNIPIAVEAMRNGAFDFLEKPVNPENLLRSLEAATALSFSQSCGVISEDALEQVLHKLTERQLEVLKHLLNGEGVRLIAKKLGISLRTVQGHRVQIYKAFGIHRFEQLSSLSHQILDRI